MRYRQFEDLPVWKDAAELARLMLEFTSIDVFRSHPRLRNQLEGASFSVSNNVAEGFERETTNALLAILKEKSWLSLYTMRYHHRTVIE